MNDRDGEIGEEIPDDTDQILTFLSGTGDARVGGQKRQVTHGDLVVVPAGAEALRQHRPTTPARSR